jgi:superfamily I DNA/RNA helicase
VLFDSAEVERSMLAAALAEPIETWMTWLHPEQSRLVRQSRNGPARVRGPAGTGKTVVGLHRAAYLAATRPGQILVTSFVRTLPAVMRALYGRLSPDTADRVDFVGLHKWAFDLLRARGINTRCDQERAKALYGRAWVCVGRHGPLGSLPAHPDYWWDEISCVIKGRGITDFADYASLRRVGRRTRLQVEHRAAVWDLFLAYDAELRSAGVRDLNDVLRLALDSVRDRPLDPPYVSVIVDEVQDLNKLGVQLLHALVGDRPDGLLLVGDGQQAVYPGGFTLAEAGIGVAGRSTVLKVNYRNAAEILDVATAVVSGDQFEDLDGPAQNGTRDVQVARTGGATIRVDQPDGALHDAALLAAIRSHRDDLEVRLGDMAVLAGTTTVAAKYRRLLTAAGMPAVDLEAYHGVATDAVKVGTFHRAKGLEFAHVYLPRLREPPVDRLRDETDTTYRERLELAHRQLFVGMTRARDVLWLGYCGGP